MRPDWYSWAMISFDDPIWKTLRGGYRQPYDPTSVLREIDQGVGLTSAWDELWNKLHHQRDVGECSYACVPILVSIHENQDRLDWNLYSLASTIEIERHRESNPPIPDWLVESYESAWRSLLTLALKQLPRASGVTEVQSMLAAIAIAKGNLKWGKLILDVDESEVDEILERWG